MSMYPHRAIGPGPPNNQGRFNELLDQVRSEFDSQIRTCDNYESQIQAQVNEMQLIRDKVYGLEQAHMALKAKYEQEISLLRRELDQSRGGGSLVGPSQHAGPSGPPPSIAPGNGLFSGIMSGSGQGGLAPPPHAAEQMGGQHQGLPAPPPQSQQSIPPQYPQTSSSNNLGPQPPQSTASPGPGRRWMSRPPPAPGPATPQINTSVPVPGVAQSPQVSHPTPEHARSVPRIANSLGDIDIDHLPAHAKKQGSDWHVVYNLQAPRALDVDLVHTLDHTSVVCCVRFSHDGRYVATGCNRAAQIFEVQTGDKKCVLQDETVLDAAGDLYIRSVCFSPDGKYLATGAEDKLIRVWDIQTRQIRNRFAGHDQDIYSLDFASDGRTIASGSGDRSVRLWDIESGNNTFTLTIEDGVTTVAISPDCKYVAAGSLDKSVRVWDMHQGFIVERLEGQEGHKDSVYSVAFSPNGKDLVSGSLDKTIKLWELSGGRPINGQGGPKHGRCIKTFEGHKDFVLSVALTPDGAWVMSGSKDRGVQFWDPRTGQVQLMLQGHKNSVISVAPSPTGGYFATGSGDSRARIWSYSSI